MHSMSNSDYLEARLGTNEKPESQFKNSDPFNKTWDELKTLGGIEENFKRRITRQVNKAMTQEGYLATNSNINLLSTEYLDQQMQIQRAETILAQRLLILD